MVVIVPDIINKAINDKLDGVLKNMPQAKESRKHLYNQLLDYYNEHGIIPDFKIGKANT